MQAERYAYESVDMEAIDEAECEENGIINKGVYIRSQIIRKPKRHRRLPPGSECRTYVWAFWSALVVFCIILLMTLYVLEHKGYHLKSPDSKEEERLRGSKHKKRTPSSWVPSDDIGKEESLESHNLPTRDHNNEEFETDYANTRIPIPSLSHITITAKAKIPGVNVQVHGVKGSTTQPSEFQNSVEPKVSNQAETANIDKGIFNQNDVATSSMYGNYSDPNHDLQISETQLSAQKVEEVNEISQDSPSESILESREGATEAKSTISSDEDTIINVDPQELKTGNVTLSPQQDIHRDSIAPSENQSTQIESGSDVKKDIDDDALWKSENAGGK